MREETGHGSILVWIADTFDGITARRLERWLSHAGPGTRLRVDLTRVRQFHDFALAVLAQAMTRCEAHVTLLGLSRHQILPLRCFDVDTGALERAVAFGSP